MFKFLMLAPLALMAMPAIAADTMKANDHAMMTGDQMAAHPMAAKPMSASEKRAADRCHKMAPAKAAKNATCIKMMKAMAPPMEKPMEHAM